MTIANNSVMQRLKTRLDEEAGKPSEPVASEGERLEYLDYINPKTGRSQREYLDAEGNVMFERDTTPMLVPLEGVRPMPTAGIELEKLTHDQAIASLSFFASCAADSLGSVTAQDMLNAVMRRPKATARHLAFEQLRSSAIAFVATGIYFAKSVVKVVKALVLGRL